MSIKYKDYSIIELLTGMLQAHFDLEDKDAIREALEEKTRETFEEINKKADLISQYLDTTPQEELDKEAFMKEVFKIAVLYKELLPIRNCSWLAEKAKIMMKAIELCIFNIHWDKLP